MSVWATGGLLRSLLGPAWELSLNGVLGLIRVSLMGSWGVHGVVVKVRYTVMKVN